MLLFKVGDSELRIHKAADDQIDEAVAARADDHAFFMYYIINIAHKGFINMIALAGPEGKQNSIQKQCPAGNAGPVAQVTTGDIMATDDAIRSQIKER